MRKVTALLLVLALLVSLVPAAGFAQDQPQEQLIWRQVGLAYFDVWKHTSGEWQDSDGDGVKDGPKGDPNASDPSYWQNKKARATYTLPSSLLEKYKVTRIEVRGEFGQEEYDAYVALQGHGYPNPWWRLGMDESAKYYTWARYRDRHYDVKPENFSVRKTDEDLSKGTAVAQWQLNLAPKKYAINRKENRFPGDESNPNLANAVEGWRWWLPVYIEWYGIPKEVPPDFYAKITPKQVQADPGQKLTFTATFGLKQGFSKPSRARLSAYHVVNGREYPVTLEPESGAPDPKNPVEFQPGQEYKYKVSVTAQDEDSKVMVKINPVDVSEDADWSDNSDEALIAVIQQQPPTGSGELVLQAYSYPGKDLRGNYQPSKPRPVNTAKWSDDVTATLTVKKPRPPRGTLDWWEISSAKLTYPKQHPSFSFGRPLPPQGTVTVNMKVPGRADPDTDELKATAKFVEDWAMDGFPVYSMIDGKQLTTEKPKDYPVTATYTVRYRYHYVVCDEDGSCYTIYVTAEDTRTATQNLKVTGAGTVPYAS
ncbi:hypothetical protein SAMN02745218_01202 [Desulfofundulus australicus DSM 11792]|uniref:Uncharacterized protein n=2 Tax=Desulfofundulus australicus TaxID=1566 RepID=A0A1M4XX39_9FIRM|nr:hypothetical protein SAMN02745218_01202 [Desulfofundulus australicus DSM 11792]